VCSSSLAEGDDAACCGSALVVPSSGLATGVDGGVRSLDLVSVAAPSTGGGCCAS
jgi:hypothetical protein